MITKKMLERAKVNFKEHKSTLVFENDAAAIIDWKKEGTSEYAVRYILDKGKGDLVVTGDLGTGVFSFRNEASITIMYSLMNDPGYAVEKLQCSTDYFTYRLEDIKEDVREMVKKYGWGFHTDVVSEMVLDYHDGILGTEKAEELADTLGVKMYAFERIGERVHPRICLWCIGFRMAVDGLK